MQTLTIEHAPTFRLTVMDESDEPEVIWYGTPRRSIPEAWTQAARERVHKAYERETKRKPTKTVKRRPLPSNFAVGASLPYVAGSQRPLDAKQTAAYEAAMGPWTGAYSEQFDYTGAPRYSYTDAWTKVKHTREDQLAQLTGLTVA